jgi:uncharacterized protein (DUF2384 family)
VQVAFDAVTGLLANLSSNASLPETVQVASTAATILNNATLCSENVLVQDEAASLRLNISRRIEASIVAQNGTTLDTTATSLFSVLKAITLDPSQVSNGTLASVVRILNGTTDLVQSQERAQAFLATISNLLGSERPDVRVCINGTYNSSSSGSTDPKFTRAANPVVVPIRPDDALRILDAFKGAVSAYAQSLPCDASVRIESSLAAAQVGSYSSYASFVAAPVNPANVAGVSFAVPNVTGFDLVSSGCLLYRVGQIGINPYENFRNITARNVTEGNMTNTFETKCVLHFCFRRFCYIMRN